MSNFTNYIAPMSRISLNFVIFFQKLFDVISFCKKLFVSKFPLKTAAAETSRENSIITSTNPYFYVQQNFQPFLDLKVGIKNGNITSDLYMKATDRHQYLNHISAHPYHTKKSVVFSQALRLSRLCTFEIDFESHNGWNETMSC